MSSTEQVEIVTSFPLPPKQFYEHLNEEEILQLKPPEIPKGTIKIFGVDQKLIIEDKENLKVSDDLMNELKVKKKEIFDKFKQLLNEIEIIQDPTKPNEFLKSIDEPFQSIFDITSKLSTIQAAVSLEKYIKKDLEEIETFIKENNL